MKKSTLFLLLATQAVPGYSTVFGPLANFDVVNDTGQVAHGFQIDIPGIHASDITSLFGDAARWPGMERYGSPTVTETSTGVTIIYQATNANNTWSAGTPSGTLPVSPSDSCWPLGAPNYGPLYPCDHFGVSTTVNTPNVTYSWLVESTPGASTLTPVAATVPNPVWTVTPAPAPPPPAPGVAPAPAPAPAVAVHIAAPQPEAFEFGEPRWVKVTATGTLQNVAIEDLVAENAVIQKANTQTQLEWQLLQTDTGNPNAGQIDLTGVALDPGATGVVYRFEYYQFTGKRDPATNEAIPGPNGDTPGANGPSPGDLGQFIVAQNAGINFDGVVPPAPPMPNAPALNASISDATVNAPYNQVVSATPGVPGDTITLDVQGLPAGLTFNPATNAITGTPSVVGSSMLSITVTDTVNGLSTTATTPLNVVDAPLVFPSPFTLTNGTVGVAYNQPLSVTGGYGAITYSDNGSLATLGLSIVGNAITGKPTTAGTPSVTITATDSLGTTQVATATLSIGAAPVACSGTNKVITNVTATSLDIGGGINNGGQSVTTGGATKTFVSPLTANSTIKTGMLLSYSGTVNANSYCAATTLTIAPGLSLSTTGLPAGTVGSAYPTTALTPAGGVKPYTMTVNGLPAGLSFNGSSIIGTPTTSGTSTVSVSVNDAINETVNSSLSLTINPAAAGGPSCTKPAGATGGLNSMGTITTVAGNVITFKTSKGALVTVTVPACASIQWNGGAKSFAVGQAFEWNGYNSAATGNVAQQVTIN